MKTRTTISALISLAICVIAFLWQRGHIACLKEEADRLREQRTLATVSLRAPRGTSTDADETVPLVAIPSRGRIRALWPSGVDSLDRTTASLVVPRLVEAVRDCDSSQLLQLAKGLSGSKTDVFLQKLVLILASEDDPEGALEIWDNSYQNVRRAENVRASILAQLAKRDPRRALAKLERVGLENRGQSLCRLAVAQELLRHGDIDAGLELMGKVGLTGAGYPLNGVLSASYDADAGIMTATSDPKLEAALWRAANERPAGRERSIVLTGLMKREAQRGGIEAVEQAFASVENFGDEERNAIIESILSPHASGGEVEKVEFVREHATGEYRSKAVNKIVSAWIHRDINAAGTWLGEQPPSPDRDQWIVEFTHSIHPIEPDAAAVWVDEIGDAELRARTAKLLGIKLQE